MLFMNSFHMWNVPYISKRQGNDKHSKVQAHRIKMRGFMGTRNIIYKQTDKFKNGHSWTNNAFVT